MTDAPLKKERPLSPHLQIYRPQITSASSIFHRMSGMALTIGLFIVVWGLIALAQGPSAYENFIACMQSTVGQLALMGWSLAFFYHFFSGLRHLVRDCGYWYENHHSFITGWAVILLAIIASAATWLYIYRDSLLGGAL